MPLATFYPHAVHIDRMKNFQKVRAKTKRVNFGINGHIHCPHIHRPYYNLFLEYIFYYIYFLQKLTIQNQSER
jgi:hypothetical protein